MKQVSMKERQWIRKPFCRTEKNLYKQTTWAEILGKTVSLHFPSVIVSAILRAVRNKNYETTMNVLYGPFRALFPTNGFTLAVEHVS